MMAPATIHASCVVVGEAGVLIRGPSGAGKSSLSAALIDRAEAQGLFGRLVADDRTRLSRVGGRVLAEPPEALKGLIERRGVGLFRLPTLRACVVRFVVDIEDLPERMPEPESATTRLLDAPLPRIAVRRGDPEAAAVALFAARNWSSVVHYGSELAFAPQHGKMMRSAPHAPVKRTGRPMAASPDPERNEFCAETA
ncbi:HPr kinase/phosphatase C-terminal domain-containing protein [Hansschlegelia sp.]|uniref:HPr kinase/phosphorylase n=1 Tax=Hansschlegelia sp. TaxID=2041892 RepID=UPI002CDDB5BC|nr:HPr kinase/phosphatase C-terminal domain-containing protein [Hansschlegelia sp.]HVI27829.1 HPr kinase/phosphatase C-terminal domain-containing protein [Hansschlegelia sp.]